MPIYRQAATGNSPKRKTWMMCARRYGSWIRRSTGTTSKREARRRLAAFEDEIQAQAVLMAESHRLALHRLVGDLWRTVTPVDIEVALAHAYVHQRHAEGVPAATILREVEVVHRLGAILATTVGPPIDRRDKALVSATVVDILGGPKGVRAEIRKETALRAELETR